ncbi:MAG: hypothetical protein ACP5VF_10525 [Acidobacteriota bacterium]
MDMEKLVEFIRGENEETRRHFDVVADGVRSDIRLLAEGHGALVEKVDHLDAKVDRLETKVDHLDTRMEVLETKVDHLETRMDVLETKVDHLDTRMEVLETKVDHLDTRMDALETKVDHLDTRMDVLETKVDHLEIKVDHLDTRMDGVETRLDSIETKLDDFIVETRTNFEEVRASIKFSYAELDRRITFLEAGFKDLAARVASIETRQMH